MALQLAAIPAAVIARFGPWFGRLAANSPALAANVAAKLRASGVVVGGTVKDIVAYARANPGNAALVISALVSLGQAVSELFDNADEKDPAVKAALVDLRAREGSADQSVRNAARFEILKIADESAKLKVGVSDTEVMLATAAEVLGFAKSFFGGERAALAAHGLIQAFFEMSTEDVEAGFRRLKL